MPKQFNITGICKPEKHYMVDISERLQEIRKMIENGDYFVINRGRQYGKTTTLYTLKKYLADNYTVISMDFEEFSHDVFASEETFCKSFGGEFLDTMSEITDAPVELTKQTTLMAMFSMISKALAQAEKPVVLLIDEVDAASNNQVFLDFLSQLRSCYLKRDEKPTFQSVILAGVTDIHHIRSKIRPEDQHRMNSPWNIAAPFDIEMSLSVPGIAAMLQEYEKDHATGMDCDEIVSLLYEYTSGYPVLVSWLCKYMDEKLPGKEGFTDSSAWTKEGMLAAIKSLRVSRIPLFDSVHRHIVEEPEMADVIKRILFRGEQVTYGLMDDAMNLGIMYGYIRRVNSHIEVANRIFETLLYDHYLIAEEGKAKDIFRVEDDKSKFIEGGRLNMRLILERFAVHFEDVYGTETERFIEDDGRKLFLLYLKPIINGVGNYYVEAETRDHKHTDVIVDYRGEQFVIELKIWKGDAYNTRGEAQLSEYLDYFHQQTGYMLSFCFNKDNTPGVSEIKVGDKTLIEAVV